MDKTDRLRDYGLAFLLYEHGLGVCGYELIRELFIFIKLILNSYLMGRNKYSAGEIKEIGKLLRLKTAGNRLQQKMIRHDLRVDYEFNISDFNEPGKAFGEEELQAAIKRGAIQILDDATIEAMKAKRARDKARDEAERQKEAVASGEQTDWQEAMKEWNEYYEK